MLRSRLVREGSIGLFLLLGLIVFGGIIFFLKGARFQNNSYKVKLQFENAGGLTEGGKVLYRGVQVGKIVDIQPSSNGIEITTEIDSKLPIPKDVSVSTVKSGLLGEVSVNLTPETELNEEAKEINPLSDDCIDKNLILCNNQVIQGKSSPDLIATLSKIGELLSSNPALFENINTAVENIAVAGGKASKLSDDLSGFMKDVKKDLDKVSQAVDKFETTADAVTRAAEATTIEVDNLAKSFENTSGEVDLLVNNLNSIIGENKTSLSNAIVDFSKTTREVSQLAQNANSLIGKVDHSFNENDVKILITDLTKATNNFEEISNNLLVLSKEINNPTNLATLQQTLDSARVTFANAAKITSDLDELTGNPKFRTDVLRLVNGLSKLISYTELLEKQVQLAVVLESAQKITVDNSTVKFSKFKTDPNVNLSQQKIPKNLSLKID